MGISRERLENSAGNLANFLQILGFIGIPSLYYLFAGVTSLISMLLTKKYQPFPYISLLLIFLSLFEVLLYVFKIRRIKREPLNDPAWRPFRKTSVIVVIVFFVEAAVLFIVYWHHTGKDPLRYLAGHMLCLPILFLGVLLSFSPQIICCMAQKISNHTQPEAPEAVAIVNQEQRQNFPENDLQRDILEYFRPKPNGTRKECAAALGKTEKTIIKEINRLKELKLIKRENNQWLVLYGLNFGY